MTLLLLFWTLLINYYCWEPLMLKMILLNVLAIGVWCRSKQNSLRCVTCLSLFFLFWLMCFRSYSPTVLLSISVYNKLITWFVVYCNWWSLLKSIIVLPGLIMWLIEYHANTVPSYTQPKCSCCSIFCMKSISNRIIIHFS